MPIGGSGQSFSTFNDFLRNQIKLSFAGEPTEPLLGKKVAIVLYTLKEDETTNIFEDYSYSVQTFLETDPTIRLSKCIIRIDGLHDNIANPTLDDIELAKTAQTLEELRKTPIPLHPVAVASSGDLPLPEPGQYIIVSSTKIGNNTMFFYDDFIGYNLLMGGAGGEKNDLPDFIYEKMKNRVILMKGDVDIGGALSTEKPKDEFSKWHTLSYFSDYAIYRPDDKVFHYGVDIGKSKDGGEPWLATVDGTVIRSETSDSYRPFIVGIRATDGTVHLYGHLSKELPHASVGTTVTKGSFIGHLATQKEIKKNTAELKKSASFLPHVHYEILSKESAGRADKDNHLEWYMDPLYFLATGKYQHEKARRLMEFPIFYNF